jgi:error-prone DNA polymerase
VSKNFTHLSVASGYSFKFGTASPEKLVAKAAELNLKTLALTDHDNMAGAIRFAKSCEEFGITPVLFKDRSGLPYLPKVASSHPYID